MKRTFSIIIIVCWVFAACQPTPKTEAVQSKNDGVMEQVISEGEKIYESDDSVQNESEELAETVEERADMLTVGTWTDNNIEGNSYITISADAEILMPDVDDYKIYEIIPLSPIPDEILRNLLRLLVEDNILYDGNKKSKEEIEKTILVLKKAIYDYENDEFKDSFSTDQGRTYEEFKADEIKNLQMLISTLEEGIENGDYELNTVAGIDEIDFDNTVYLKADLGRDALANFTIDEKHSFLLRNPGNYFIDYRGELISELIPEEEKELKISAEYAINKISTLMNDIGLTSYNIRYMGIDKECHGNEVAAGYSNLEQGYVLVYSRIVNGMPVECSSDFNVQTLEDGSMEAMNYVDAFKYYAENLSFVVDDKGITQMDWEYHYDVDEESATIVEIMEMDDALKQVIIQQIINCYSFYEEQGTKAHFDIERVELVMGRVPMKDNLDKQWLVPMWNVYAYYEINHPGEETFITPNSRLVLSINALDGSVN